MRLKTNSFWYTLLVAIPAILFFGSVAVLSIPLDRPFLSRRIADGKWGLVATWTKRNWARFLLWVHGVQVEICGPQGGNLQNIRQVVFVANHQSALDILVCLATMPATAHFISKKELKWVPFLGWAANAVGTLFVDRARGVQNKSLESVNEWLKKGMSLIVYPEGTRSVDGKLLPFKRGAFVMAIEAQVPIVPVVIEGSHELMPKKRLSIASGFIRMYVDNPVLTTGLTYTDRGHLAEQVRDQMAKHLEKLRETRNNKISA